MASSQKNSRAPLEAPPAVTRSRDSASRLISSRLLSDTKASAARKSRHPNVPRFMDKTLQELIGRHGPTSNPGGLSTTPGQNEDTVVSDKPAVPATEPLKDTTSERGRKVEDVAENTLCMLISGPLAQSEVRNICASEDQTLLAQLIADVRAICSDLARSAVRDDDQDRCLTDLRVSMDQFGARLDIMQVLAQQSNNNATRPTAVASNPAARRLEFPKPAEATPSPQKEANRKQTVNYTSPKLKTWAEVAAQPALQDVSETVKVKLLQVKAKLQDATRSTRDHNISQSSLRPSKPKPTALYFANLPRGPIGQTRRLIQEALPAWSILHISPINGSICEILTHTPLADRVKATLCLLGMKSLNGFDPRKRTRLANTSTEDHTKAKLACFRRWAVNSQVAGSPAVKTWYHAACLSLRSEDNSLPTIETVKNSYNMSRNGSNTQKGAGQSVEDPCPDEPVVGPNDCTNEASQSDNEDMIAEEANNEQTESMSIEEGIQNEEQQQMEEINGSTNPSLQPDENQETPPKTRARVLRNKSLPKSPGSPHAAAGGRLERKRIRLLRHISSDAN